MFVQQETTDKATAELSIVVDELLNQLSAKFAGISEELISKSILISLTRFLPG